MSALFFPEFSFIHTNLNGVWTRFVFVFRSNVVFGDFFDRPGQRGVYRVADLMVYNMQTCKQTTNHNRTNKAIGERRANIGVNELVLSI